MSASGVTQFSGMAGRVLWGTMGFRSLASGFVMGLLLLVGSWALITATAEAMVTPFTQIVFALALARFAINGQFGEWEGTVFSGAGGSWGEVVIVAFRYLLLTFIWLLPLILLGLDPEMMAAAGPMAMADKKAFTLLCFYFFGSMLTPPLLLIISITASNLGDLFSVRHWRGVFGGHADEVFAIYAIYTGGVGMALVLLAPFVILGFIADVKFGVFVAGIAFAFLFGLSLNLLGRLCGFFALGDFEIAQPAASQPATPDRPPVSSSALSAERFIGESAPAPAGTQVVETFASAAAPDPVQQPVSSKVESLPLSSVSTGPSQHVDEPAKGTPYAPYAKKPPLMDGKKHIEATLGRFKQNPESALTALEDLRESYAPHPHVLWALCICRHRTGNVDGAFELAGPALSLCFERGHTHLAADVFKELRANAKKLGLNREQILSIAAASAAKKDFGTAGEAYSMIIGKDPGDVRAIKGMIQVAEGFLREKSNPAIAAKVYHFLLERCGDSPLAEFAYTGLKEAERRLAKP